MPKEPKAPTARYGIAEWFGIDITVMTTEERDRFAQLAIKQDQNGDLSGAPICPFLSTLIPAARCNKASGVCTIRKFASAPDGTGIADPASKVVTLCPSRFLQQPISANKSLFTWISEKMLDIGVPTIVKETPFLRKISDTPPRSPDVVADMEIEAEEEKKAGRIDWGLW